MGLAIAVLEMIIGVLGSCAFGGLTLLTAGVWVVDHLSTHGVDEPSWLSIDNIVMYFLFYVASVIAALVGAILTDKLWDYGEEQ